LYNLNILKFMRTEKKSLANLQGKLSRKEMKGIMAGIFGGVQYKLCAGDWGCTDGNGFNTCYNGHCHHAG
jgi:hypothetical protein